MRPLPGKKTKKPVIMDFSVLFVLFGQILPDLVLKQAYIKGKVSTDRSGEDQSHPSSTLSFPILQFDLSGHVLKILAMNYRLNGL